MKTKFLFFQLWLFILFQVGCNQISGLSDLELSVDTETNIKTSLDADTNASSLTTDSVDTTTGTNPDTTIVADTFSTTDSTMDTSSNIEKATDTTFATDFDSDTGSASDTDNNSLSTDSETETRSGICGDGKINQAFELCDDGEENGQYNKCHESCLFVCQRSCPIRVDLANGDDSNDGATWARAKRTMKAAISAQVDNVGGDVWVTSGEISGRIEMQPGVRLYGGFAGGEQSITERPDESWTTIVGIESIIDGGGKSVVLAARNSELNRFHLRNGLANYPTAFAEEDGGGLLSENIGDFTVRECKFEGNAAYQYGGGMYIKNSIVTIEDCIFAGNSAPIGGAIAITDGAIVTISNSRFESNYLFNSPPHDLVAGGAIYSLNSEVSILNSVLIGNAPYDITENTTVTFGESSAIYTDGGSVTVRNSDVYNNMVMVPSVSILKHVDTAVLYANCTFAENGGGPTDNAVIVFEGDRECVVVGCTFAFNILYQVDATNATAVTVANTLADIRYASQLFIRGTATESHNCTNWSEFGKADATMLATPIEDADGNGVPEYYLDQSDDNYCFIQGGNEVDSINAGIDWSNMSSAKSGCIDAAPIDLGRHYPAADNALECL